MNNITLPFVPTCAVPPVKFFALLRPLLPLVLLFAVTSAVKAQTTYMFNTNIASATGAWGTAGTWTNSSGSPVAGDTVIMMGGNSKNLGVNGDRTIKDLPLRCFKWVGPRAVGV
jgi:hypothetical protein